VENNPQNRKMDSLRTQMLDLHMECIELAQRLQSPIPSIEEKADLAHQWESAMEQSFALQSLLEHMTATSHVTVH
jgi:hypothetical protein